MREIEIPNCLVTRLQSEQQRGSTSGGVTLTSSFIRLSWRWVRMVTGETGDCWVHMDAGDVTGERSNTRDKQRISVAGDPWQSGEENWWGPAYSGMDGLRDASHLEVLPMPAANELDSLPHGLPAHET